MKPQPKGRPPISQEPQKPRTVTLTDSAVAKLKEIGGGNISAGIRKLLEERK